MFYKGCCVGENLFRLILCKNNKKKQIPKTFRD